MKNIKKNKKHVLFATDFKPNDGGVAEFGFNIAKNLHQKNLLLKVITEQPQIINYGFKVQISHLNHQRNLYQRFGDNFFIIRKLNTLLHKSIIVYQSLMDILPLLRHKNLVILSTCYYSYEEGIWLRLCNLFGIEFQLLLHGLDIIENHRKTSKSFKLIFKRATKITYNSKATRELAHKNGYLHTNEKICYPPLRIPKEVHSMQFSKSEYLKIKGINHVNKIIISSVTRLIKRKGLDIAINAIAKLKPEIKRKILFLIAGRGNEYENLNLQIKKLKLEEHVKLLGFIDDTEKYFILGASNIFLLPCHDNSEKDWEGFGISLIEAAYFHNLVIAGKTGGTVEAVNPETGYLIDFGEPDAVQKLTELLDFHISTGNFLLTKDPRQYVEKKFLYDNFSWI